MTVELWSGEEFEHLHEMAALSDFLHAMVLHYGDDPNRYLVLSNFIINNKSVDLAVLKRNAIIVIELKEVGARVVGGENGPWMIGEPGEKKVQLRGGGHGNPFIQVRTYRQTMIDFLFENQGRFLRPRAGKRPALQHVAAFIALSPHIPEGSEITLPKLRWMRLIGLDKLHLEVYRERSPDLNFSKREMYTLVRDVMRLRQGDIGKLIGEQMPTAAVRTPAPPDLPEERPESPEIFVEDPLTVQVASADRTHISIEEPHKETPVTVAIPTPTAERCFLCRLTDSSCDLIALRGTIIKSGKLSGGHPGLLIDTGELEPTSLFLEEPWKDLAERVHLARSKLLTSGADVDLKLVAYHLHQCEGGYTASEDSLVILDPDWLIRVTDLTRVEFCQRQLLLERYNPSPSNKYAIRGTIVHQLFQDIWEKQGTSDFALAKQNAYTSNVESFIWAGAHLDEVEEEVDNQVLHLHEWSQHQGQRKSELRSETFVLSPAVGIKGRIDALWVHDDKPVVLGELKTGKSQGKRPKPGHELQLLSYALTVIYQEELEPSTLHGILLYSGNDRLGSNGRNVMRRVELSLDKMRETIRVRNDLVLIDHTGEARFEQNPNKCNKCYAAHDCMMLAQLGGHEDTRETHDREWLRDPDLLLKKETPTYFQHYASLLTDELRAVKAKHAELWSLTPEERMSKGKAFSIGSVEIFKNDVGVSKYTFTAAGERNESEFRRGDYVLISGRLGPGVDRSAFGTVTDTSRTSIVVRTNDEVRFEPKWVDLYSDENLTERLFSGIYQFLRRKKTLVDVVVNEKDPTFIPAPPIVDLARLFGDVHDLNDGQKQALERSLGLNDYLLVLGPPGSGKTMLIEHMVRSHLELNRRVLISAGTNRAVDKALKQLVARDLSSEVIRLGNRERVAPDLQPYTLSSLIESKSDLSERIEFGKQLLNERRVVGGTAHALLTGRYDAALGRFDLVIVDEAAQLTVPATLGPLRFADRFVLIGDHKQLPAIVTSKPKCRTDASLNSDADDRGLDVSLFELLIRNQEDKESSGLVRLVDQ